MTMNITSKQMEITPAIRQHVADRLAKLEKWQTHLINPHIILSKEPQGFVADATINTPNGVLVASGKHEDMYTAINELINKLERQLNKLQHKGEARRAATSVKDANFVEEVEAGCQQARGACHQECPLRRSEAEKSPEYRPQRW